TTMLPYIYHPKINLGILSMNTWGAIVAIGFVISLLYALKRAEKSGTNKNHIYNLSLLAILSGIIGSRLFFIITTKAPIREFFRLWQGGLTFIGGLALAIIICAIYIKKNKLNFYKHADTLTLPLILANMIGRIACFVGDGGHLGTPTSLPWAILGKHPTSLYYIIALTAILAIIVSMEKEKGEKKSGTSFISYLWLYSLFRFLIDFVRTEKTSFLSLNLTTTQLLLIPIFIFSTLWLLKHKKITKKKNNEPGGN
ncbi:MAG: prolipoprotein diacylglyceryl transferase, partial [Nanoarchaeota archaeon]|nr:prolipoprotein diacylglyceryl transferase [Nanoarchaeota archaeon]